MLRMDQPRTPMASSLVFAANMMKPGATIDAEYNAVFVAYGQFFELTTANGTKTLTHNYGEGLGYRSGALHGEFDQGGADGSCRAVVSQSYNTVLQPHDGKSGTAGVTRGVTALL